MLLSEVNDDRSGEGHGGDWSRESLQSVWASSQCEPRSRERRRLSSLAFSSPLASVTTEQPTSHLDHAHFISALIQRTDHSVYKPTPGLIHRLSPSRAERSPPSNSQSEVVFNHPVTCSNGGGSVQNWRYFLHSHTLTILPSLNLQSAYTWRCTLHQCPTRYARLRN